MTRRRLAWQTLAIMLPLLGAAPALAQSYSAQVIADGAIHYWRFEESSTDQPAQDEIPDQPANGTIPAQTNTPGTYEGGVELGRDSAFPALGKAAYFDEQNGTHVSLGTPQHPGNSISVEAWVLLESDFTVGFSPIVARWDGSYELDVNHAGQGGELDFVIRNDLNDFIDPHADGPMSTDEWHHVVGIFEGESDGGGVATGMVYLDGERQIDFEAVGDLQDAGGDDGSWYVGRTRNPESGFGWLGLIDEVAIYPFALSEEQIQSHINLAMSPAAPDGDFNMNGELEVGDMDLLSIEIDSQSNNPDFDLNNDQLVDLGDQSIWLADLAKIWSGDANMDGLFNTGDLIIVLTAGEFEDDIEDNSTWAEGDWNADLDFTTSDLVAALADGGFEGGMRPAVAAVPEPSTLLLCVLGVCCVLKMRAERD